MIFKFHVGKSTLYVNFVYNRQQLIWGCNWKDIDQLDVPDMVKIQCELLHEEQKIVLDVGLNWTLSIVWQELQIVQGQEFPTNFSFWIVGNGIVIEKVPWMSNPKLHSR